jgi:hypothetical protein
LLLRCSFLGLGMLVRLARALTGGTGGCCSTLQVGELLSRGIGLGGRLELGLGGGRLGLFSFVSLGFIEGEGDWAVLQCRL